MTSKQLGNIGEAKALMKFVELQIPVYQPFGDNEKADLIAEFNGKLQKIQVKSTEKLINGRAWFSTTTSTAHRKNGCRHHYTSNEVDYFALYCLEADLLLLVPFSIIGNKNVIVFALNYKKSNNQYEALNHADYTFEKVTCVETLHETSDINDEDEDKVRTTTE